ncbi:MAG: hypothetical protein V1794_15540 [Candidatus Glassbacteria bacterium]
MKRVKGALITGLLLSAVLYAGCKDQSAVSTPVSEDEIGAPRLSGDGMLSVEQLEMLKTMKPEDAVNYLQSVQDPPVIWDGKSKFENGVRYRIPKELMEKAREINPGLREGYEKLEKLRDQAAVNTESAKREIGTHFLSEAEKAEIAQLEMPKTMKPEDAVNYLQSVQDPPVIWDGKSKFENGVGYRIPKELLEKAKEINPHFREFQEIGEQLKEEMKRRNVKKLSASEILH